MTAFAGIEATFPRMAALSSVVKRDLSAMGKQLFTRVPMISVAGGPCDEMRSELDALLALSVCGAIARSSRSARISVSLGR